MALDALFSAITDKSPLFFVKLADPVISNYGSINLSSIDWQGGLPSIIPTENGDFAELDGFKWVLFTGADETSTDNGITFETLVEIDEFRRYSRLFESNAGGTDTVKRLIFTQGTIPNQVLIRTGSTPLDQIGALEHNKLLHIAYTSNPSTGNSKYYVNGILILETNTTPISNVKVSFILGELFYSIWGYIEGNTDEITKGKASYSTIYGRELSASEIASHANMIAGLGSKVVVAIQASDHFSIKANNHTWANKETLAQANPYPPLMQHVERQESIDLIGKVGGYSTTLDQNGQQRKTGYIASTVTLTDIPSSGRKVLLYSQSGVLMDETRSDAAGNYRFDHLLLNQKYMTVAQYGSSDGVTPPDYLATAADFLTPTPYA